MSETSKQVLLRLVLEKAPSLDWREGQVTIVKKLSWLRRKELKLRVYAFPGAIGSNNLAHVLHVSYDGRPLASIYTGVKELFDLVRKVEEERHIGEAIALVQSI